MGCILPKSTTGTTSDGDVQSGEFVCATAGFWIPSATHAKEPFLSLIHEFLQLQSTFLEQYVRHANQGAFNVSYLAFRFCLYEDQNIGETQINIQGSSMCFSVICTSSLQKLDIDICHI